MGNCLSSCSQSNQADNHAVKAAYQGTSPPLGSHNRPPIVPNRNPSLTSVPQATQLSAMEHRISNGSRYNGNNARNGIAEHRQSKHGEFSADRVSALFEKYRDNADDDMILLDGMQRFCQDLQVNPSEYIVLLLAWKLQAAVMCRFTRSEFTNGCRALQADSIRAIRNKFPQLRNEVNNEETFKDLYRFTFSFGLDIDSGQRSLPCEMAVPLWRLVFTQRDIQILDRWCDFLTVNEIRGISRDTWQMFLNLTEVIGDDLSNYDDSEAWPSLFDDFVEYENSRLAKKREDSERTENIDDGYDDGEGSMV